MTERLFVAVGPPPAARDALDTFLDPRRPAGPELRWALPESWHLTCAFMGRVRPESEDDLVEALLQVGARTAPFPLTVAGAGAFPHPDAAKVLWLGITQGATELGALAARCRNAAASCGIDVDGAVFRPHLTIARANGVRALRWLEILDTIEPQTWQVRGFRLIRSLRLPGGAGYQTLAEFRLGG